MKRIIYMLSTLLLAACVTTPINKEKQAVRLKQEAQDAIIMGGKNAIPMAHGLINNALELAPQMGELYATRASLLVQEHRMEEALEAMDKAIELDSGNPELWSQKGFIYRELNDSTKIKQNFEKAIELYDGYIINKENEDREAYLINKYHLKAILDDDRDSNIKELEQIMSEDSSLDSQRINSGIFMLKKLDIQKRAK